MSKTGFSVLWVIAALALSSPGEVRASITVNGNLSDWGVSVGNNNTTTYPVATVNKTGQNGLYGRYAEGSHTTSGGFSYYYFIEDSIDTASASGQLGPNQGGQNYDGEFIGVGIDGDELTIAILTGQTSDNPFDSYSPGDIRIVTSHGVYGIEVGGGVGGNGSTVTNYGDAGTTYKVSSNGSTVGVKNSNGTSSGNVTGMAGPRATQTAGSLWHNPTWIADPISHPTDLVQMQFTGGSLVNTSGTSFIYSRPLNSQHAVIEVSIKLSAFLNGGNSVSFNEFSWFPSCGNDALRIDLSGGNSMLFATPEPTSIGLMAMAGLAFAGAWPIRRRRASRG